MSETNPTEGEKKEVEEIQTPSESIVEKNEEKSVENSKDLKEKEEKREEESKGKEEEKKEANGAVIEVAHPQNMSEHRHSLQCSSVKSVSIFWDENLRYRKSMEDGHVVVDQLGGKSDRGYFAIYDGHGGIDAVVFVANTLHKNLELELEKSPDNVSEALKQSYLVTDQQIAEKSISSGTTAVSAIVTVENGKRMLYTANAGDARAVLNRGGKAKRVSHDHKVADEGEQKRIQDLGGYIIMHRVNGVLAVTRSLGDISMKEYVTGEPYLEVNELTDEDTHLIIACDGLWDVVDDQEAVELIVADEKKDNLSQLLVQTALKKGSMDNISIMVVSL